MGVAEIYEMCCRSYLASERVAAAEELRKAQGDLVQVTWARDCTCAVISSRPGMIFTAAVGLVGGGECALRVVVGELGAAQGRGRSATTSARGREETGKGPC